MRSTDLSGFKYWCPELESLLDVFQEPLTFRHVLRDRTDKVRFMNFWATVITAFVFIILFGVVGLVWADKQYAYAVESKKVADESYNLALAVACAEYTDLAKYCKDGEVLGQE